MEYFQERDQDLRLFVYEIVDGRKPSDLNVQIAPCQNTYEQPTC